MVPLADNLLLQLLMGPVLAVPVPTDLSNALQSVQVTSAVGSASGFQLSFAVSKNSIITNALLPVGFFDPRIRVIVVAIVNGTPNVLIDGIITKHEMSPSNTPGGSTFTVTGEDLTRLMDLDQHRTPFPGMPPQAQVVEALARYSLYGVVPLTIPPVLTNVYSPTERIPIQTMTDLAYIKQLANDVGWTFYITPGPLPGANIAYWGPDIRVGLPEHAVSVNLDVATNVESLSFTVDNSNYTAWTASVRIPFTHLDIQVPIPDVSLLRPPLSARPLVPMRTQALPDNAYRNPVETMLFGLGQLGDASDVVTAQGRLDVLRYGHVLNPRTIVGVRGAGLAHDGLYYVRSVTHELKRGEFKQSFSLSREGLGPITPVVLP